MNILHICDIFVHALSKQICQVSMYNNSLKHTAVVTCVSGAIIGTLVVASCQYSCAVMFPNLFKMFYLHVCVDE